MAERGENFKTDNMVKINVAESSPRDTIEASEMRELLLNERHTILMRLAAIEKFLKMSRKCKKCGNVL